MHRRWCKRLQELQLQWPHMVRHEEGPKLEVSTDQSFSTYNGNRLSHHLSRLGRMLTLNYDSRSAEERWVSQVSPYQLRLLMGIVGPKGSRAKVISELRETQRQSQLSTQRQSFNSPPGSPTFARKPALLSRDLIITCVDYFFQHLYPTQPILHRQKVGETIGRMEDDPEAYCLVVSLCGYMLIQPNLELPPSALEALEEKPQSNLHLGRALLAEAIRVRKGFNYVETPSVWSVITSFFFFGSYFCLDLHGTAWFHLREATTLALTLGTCIYICNQSSTGRREYGRR